MKETYQPGSLAPLIPENSVPARRKTGLLIAVGLGVIVLGCVALVVLLLAFRSQIPAVANLFATSTPTLTLTPTETPTATITQTPTPTQTPVASPTDTPMPATATPRFFALTSQAFSADYKGDCNSEVQITGVQGNTFSFRGTVISIRNGQMVIWCYGAKHTWIGTLIYSGYTFASDANDPLQFEVDQNRGYVYIGGSGTVTSPDGSVETLP